MSNEAQGLVRNLPLDAPTKPVLMAYANYADESGYCWPSVETIAFDTGYSAPTVTRVRRELIKAGWIGTKRRFGTTAATRLNLTRIASAGVDRGDRTRLNHVIEFEPDSSPDSTANIRQEDPDGGRSDQRDPNVPKHGETAGQSLSDQSDLIEPDANRLSDHSDTYVPIRVIATTDQSDRLSITDSSVDPSLEDRDRGNEREKTSTKRATPATGWPIELIAALDFGRHRRPTRKQASELATLLHAAHDTGLTKVELRRHCRATINAASSNAVAYLRGGLQPDQLPIANPTVKAIAAPAPKPSPSATRRDEVLGGLDPRFRPTRLRPGT